MGSKSSKMVRTSVLLPDDARAKIEALAAASDVSAGGCRMGGVADLALAGYCGA
jgi:hypothetical protein